MKSLTESKLQKGKIFLVSRVVCYEVGDPTLFCMTASDICNNALSQLTGGRVWGRKEGVLR